MSLPVSRSPNDNKGKQFVIPEETSHEVHTRWEISWHLFKSLSASFSNFLSLVLRLPSWVSDWLRRCHDLKKKSLETLSYNVYWCTKTLSHSYVKVDINLSTKEEAIYRKNMLKNFSAIFSILRGRETERDRRAEGGEGRREGEKGRELMSIMPTFHTHSG